MADTSKTAMDEMQQFEPDVFWEHHGTKIIIGILAVLGLGVAIYLWQRQQADQAEAAATRLATAQDKTALERIVQDYRGKEPAAQALLRLGDFEFQAGQFTEAAAAYQQFLNQYPRHALTESALLGQAAAAEAQGNFQDAQRLYAQLSAAHPQGYTTLSAWMGEARCLEALGQLKDAHHKYEEIMAAAQGTHWAQAAYVRWVVLGRDLPPEPPAPAPEPTGTPATPLIPAPSPQPPGK